MKATILTVRAEWKRNFRLCGALSLLLMPPLDVTAQVQQAWITRYNNGITNGTNEAVKMALDSGGNIFITGFSQNTNGNLGYVTIKYTQNGALLWAARCDSTAKQLFFCKLIFRHHS